MHDTKVGAAGIVLGVMSVLRDAAAAQHDTAR